MPPRSGKFYDPHPFRKRYPGPKRAPILTKGPDEKVEVMLFIGHLAGSMPGIDAERLMMRVIYPSRKMTDAEWGAYTNLDPATGRRLQFSRNNKGSTVQVVPLSSLKEYLKRLKAVETMDVQFSPEVLDWINRANARKAAAKPVEPQKPAPVPEHRPEMFAQAPKRAVMAQGSRSANGVAEVDTLFKLGLMVFHHSLPEEWQEAGRNLLNEYQDSEKLTEKQWMAAKRLVKGLSPEKLVKGPAYLTQKWPKKHSSEVFLGVTHPKSGKSYIKNRPKTAIWSISVDKNPGKTPYLSPSRRWARA